MHGRIQEMIDLVIEVNDVEKAIRWLEETYDWCICHLV